MHRLKGNHAATKRSFTKTRTSRKKQTLRFLQARALAHLANIRVRLSLCARHVKPICRGPNHMSVPRMLMCTRRGPVNAATNQVVRQSQHTQVDGVGLLFSVLQTRTLLNVLRRRDVILGQDRCDNQLTCHTHAQLDTCAHTGEE